MFVGAFGGICEKTIKSPLICNIIVSFVMRRSGPLNLSLSLSLSLALSLFLYLCVRACKQVCVCVCESLFAEGASLRCAWQVRQLSAQFTCISTQGVGHRSGSLTRQSCPDGWEANGCLGMCLQRSCHPSKSTIRCVASIQCDAANFHVQ